MDQGKYVILRQYLGCELTAFALNYARKITPADNFKDLNFNSLQLTALTNIYEAIKKSRHDFIDQDGFKDGFGLRFTRYKIEDEFVLNYWRRYCNGQMPKVNSNDELIKFLKEVTIESYCNLLIKEKGSGGFFPYIETTMQKSEEFERLVKADVLDNLTNRQLGLDYCFDFTLNNGIEIKSQIYGMFAAFITKSFHNCCLKMKYSIEDVLDEVETNIQKLRQLAEGEEVFFPMYLGAQGIFFKDIDVVKMHNLKIYPVDSSENPGIHTNQILTQHATEQDGTFYSGAVVEYSYKVKIDRNKVKQESWQDFANSVSAAIENVKFSICFSLKEDYSFAPKFEENGFPLIHAGNYGRLTSFPKKYIIVNKEDIKEIEDWFNKLSTIDKNSIQVSMVRLNYAIHERISIEDAITDAIIAWESMFSGKTETTFKVTGSIARYLETSENRDVFFKKIKKYYELRSKIVHGNESDFSKKRHEEKISIRDDIVAIGVKCLKKIIYDDTLLKLKPEERAIRLLVLD